MLLQGAKQHAGGYVQLSSQLHRFSKLLARESSSAAAQVAEPIEGMGKEQPAAALAQENPSLPAGAGEATNKAATAASGIDNTKVVAVFAGVLALFGGSYLMASGRKPKYSLLSEE